MTAAQVKKTLGCVVEMAWLDAHSLDPWTPVEELECLEGLPCRTYGVVVAANEHGAMVSASINGATCVGGSWFVPLPMIQWMKVLIDKKGCTI